MRPCQERVISQTIEQLSPPPVPVDEPDAIDPQDAGRAPRPSWSRSGPVPRDRPGQARRRGPPPPRPGRRRPPRQRRSSPAAPAHADRGHRGLRDGVPARLADPRVRGRAAHRHRRLVRPQPAADGTPDPRTGGQRRHDALHHLADTTLASGEVPTTHGSPAKIIVRVDLETLATALTPPGPAGDAGDAGDPGSARAAGGPEAARQPTSSEPWRAVGRGQPPTRHPSQPGHPRPPRSPAELADGTPLSRQTLARLACTADLVPILIDELGNPLDVGPHPPPVHPQTTHRPDRTRPTLHLARLHRPRRLDRRPPPDPLARRRTHRPDQRRPPVRTPPPPRPRHRHHRTSHRRPRPLGHRTATGAARAATRSARAPATGCHRPHHPHHRPPAAALDSSLAAAHPTA